MPPRSRRRKTGGARLAKEKIANAPSHVNDNSEDFIPLEAYDSDGEFKPRALQVGSFLGSHEREKDTRLVRDDEDIAEGFESFVEDSGRVTLSKKGLRQQAKADREAIRTLINEAEGSDVSDDDGSQAGHSSDSDYALNQSYEAAQTHHGMDGLSSHHAHTRIASRPRQPRETTPIPKLSVGLAQLRDMASKLEYERGRIEKRRADIARERTDIAESQAHIQASLEEAGRELERVTADVQQGKVAGANATSEAVSRMANGNGYAQQNTVQERGLESFGGSSEQNP